MKRLIFVLLFCIHAYSENYAILVHGFMRGRGNLSQLEKPLHERGFVVINWTYPSRDRTIKEHGHALLADLNEFLCKDPEAKISFVTHSLGGLVVRSILGRLPQNALGRSVFIAPPFQGSQFARKLGRLPGIGKFFGNKAGQELLTTPRGGFEHLGSIPADFPVLVISGTLGFNPLIRGTNDGKVAISESCLNSPHAHITTCASHSWICHAPWVVKMAVQFLVEGCDGEDQSCNIAHRLAEDGGLG